MACFAAVLDQFFKANPQYRGRAPRDSGVSLNKLLLVSRLVYGLGMSDNDNFLYSDDTIKGFLRQYKSYMLPDRGDHYTKIPLPYPLDHANLQMVAGADRFLEALARGERRVSVRFCNHPFEGYEHEWHSAPEGETYGRTYRTVSPLYQGKTWLCPVTLYVLGRYPKHIYIQQI